MRKPCFRYQHIVMEYDPDDQTYRVWNGQEEMELDDPENPLEAWKVWNGLLDGYMRRRIGDALEAQGKNRWTGQRKE